MSADPAELDEIRAAIADVAQRYASLYEGVAIGWHLIVEHAERSSSERYITSMAGDHAGETATSGWQRMGWLTAVLENEKHAWNAANAGADEDDEA